MKILIDLTSLADHLSGIERYAACLTFEMLKEKSNSYILIFKKSIHPMFQSWIEDKRIEAIILPECNKLFFNQVRLPFEIYKHKADWYLFLAFPVPVLLFKRNMVSTIHDLCCWDCPETMNHLSKWYYRISDRIAILKCRNIITISNYSKDRIASKLKYSRDKIWLIYCGIENRFVYRPYIASEFDAVKKKYGLPDHYLLSLCTLEPRKNIRLLLEAYQILINRKEMNLPLVLAGRKGWKMNKLLDGIDERVKGHILFTGFIEDDDLPVVYGNADLFIFPSMYEGFGLPPLEALACGAKVLSSDCSSLPEVLGSAALYFQSGDVQDLSYAIVEALRADNDINEKIKYCQAQKFTWSSEATKLINLCGK